jgi:hypothetical protein
MTDKTPERIWAWRDKETYETHLQDEQFDGGTEYVREDIHQALTAERDSLLITMRHDADVYYKAKEIIDSHAKERSQRIANLTRERDKLREALEGLIGPDWEAMWLGETEK